jgi:hypothetical protein
MMEDFRLRQHVAAFGVQGDSGSTSEGTRLSMRESPTDRFFEEGGQQLREGVEMLAEMHEQTNKGETQSLQAKTMAYTQQKLFRLRPITQFLQARWPVFWLLWSASAAIALPLIAIGMPLSMALDIGLICISFRRQILFVRMIQAEEPYSSSVSREHRETLIVIALFFILSVALRVFGGL